MLFRRILLSPITVVYGGVLHLRHTLYDRGILKRDRPTVPTIAIGNLSLGGTGKTPMLELVLRTLEGMAPLATLSRGYGRSGTEFREVMTNDTALQSGDEPLQVKRKFPDVRVFVGADRVKAIGSIHQQVPQVKVVVLDDALQHRRLDAGLNILLTTWQRPYCDDALIPAGTLRDLGSQARIAHIVVVTKCPSLPDGPGIRHWRERLGLSDDQRLFFSGIDHEPIAPFGGTCEGLTAQDFPGGIGGGPKNALAATSCLLFTGIADPAPLVQHVQHLFAHTRHIAFPDHHTFGSADLKRLAGLFGSFAAGPKMLVTTEKDAARLSTSIAGSPLEGLPLAVIGMRAIILNEPERFADLIRRHVAPHPAHR